RPISGRAVGAGSDFAPNALYQRDADAPFVAALPGAFARAFLLRGRGNFGRSADLSELLPPSCGSANGAVQTLGAVFVHGFSPLATQTCGESDVAGHLRDMSFNTLTHWLP